MHDMMNKAFYFSDMLDNLLFKDLNIRSAGGIVGVCVVLALLAMLYEFVKVIREYLFLQASTTCCQPMPGELDRLWPCSSNMTKTKRIQVHTGQTALHLVQVFMGYIIMLCVMSYNAWLLITVVTALGLGYFLFGAYIPKRFQESEDGQDSGCHPQAPRSYSSVSVSTVSHMVPD